jgi:hypothetical protein
MLLLGLIAVAPCASASKDTSSFDLQAADEASRQIQTSIHLGPTAAPRIPLSVAQAAEAPTKTPTVRTTKEVFSGREAIEVVFDGASGSFNDYVMIVPEGAERNLLTRLRVQLQKQRSGTVKFDFDDRRFRDWLPPNGSYEVRLFVEGASGYVASPIFRVAGKQGHEDRLEGRWKPKQACANSKLQVELIVGDFGGGERHALLAAVDPRHPELGTKYGAFALGPEGDLDGDYLVPKPTGTGGPYSRTTVAYAFKIFNSAGQDQIVIDHNLCPNLPLYRQTADPTTVPKLAPFNQKWVGHAESCSLTPPFDMEIKLRTIGGDIVLGLLDKINPDPFNGMPPKLMMGRIPNAEEEFTLSDATSFYTLGDSSIATLKLQYSRTEQLMVGRSNSVLPGECEYVELRPESAEKVAASATAASTPPEKTGITGEWEGTAQCGGRDIRVLMTIEDAPANRYQGAIEYAPNPIAGQINSVALIGEKAEAGTYDFTNAPVRLPQIDPNALYKAGNFKLQPGPGEDEISGIYGEGACKTLALTKRTDASLSSKVRATGAETGGFYAKRRPQERCDVIASWLGKARAEYPETDFWRMEVGQVHQKVILLFTDDQFVPVFGKPYDQMSRADTSEISRLVGQLCKTDPLRGEAVKDFAIVESGLTSIEWRYGGFGGTAIRAVVRESRRLRNEIESELSSLKEDASLQSALEALEGPQKHIRSSEPFLWPSERAAVNRKIKEKLGSYALAEVNGEMKQVFALNDPVAQIKRTTEIAEGKRVYTAHLLEADHAALLEQISLLQSRNTDKLVGNQFALIGSLSYSLAALSRLDALEAEVRPTIALLTSEVRNVYQGRIDSKRTDIFQTLIRDRISALDSHTADKHGLKVNSEWLATLQPDFARFAQRPEYKRAVERFEEVRRQLLSRSVAQFEAEISKLGQGASGAKIDSLLSDYISTISDTKRPISLEYLIVAEKAKESAR